MEGTEERRVLCNRGNSSFRKGNDVFNILWTMPNSIEIEFGIVHDDGFIK